MKQLDQLNKEQTDGANRNDELYLKLAGIYAMTFWKNITNSRFIFKLEDLICNLFSTL